MAGANRWFLVITLALIMTSLVVSSMAVVFINDNNQTNEFRSALMGLSVTSIVLALGSFGLGFFSVWQKSIDVIGE